MRFHSLRQLDSKINSPFTNKGDIITYSGSSTLKLSVGTDSQVLSADSTQGSGLKWVDLPAASGDIEEVIAGSGLTGGGPSGTVTLDVVAGTGIIVNANDIAVDVGVGPSKIVQLNGGGNLPSLNGNLLTNLNANNFTSGTLPVSRGGTGSVSALNNNRVMVSVGGNIVETGAITPNRAIASNGSGIPVHTNVSTTELGYLSGVISSIQTQLDSKQFDLGYVPLNSTGDTMTGQLNLPLNSLTAGGNVPRLIRLIKTRCLPL
jgi:trimeric autotransporter adhesin